MCVLMFAVCMSMLMLEVPMCLCRCLKKIRMCMLVFAVLMSMLMSGVCMRVRMCVMLIFGVRMCVCRVRICVY